MIEQRTADYRRWGIQLVSLFLIVSFAVIPVRCDVSAAPHSIFAAPNMLNQSGAHTHHATGALQRESAKSVPHHSPVADGASGHQHAIASDGAPVSLTERCSSLLGAGGDPESQQPVGATLDLPSSSITPDTVTLQPRGMQTQLLRFAPAALLSGIDAPPETPPPRAS
ncbi:MAG TPA: hypothetical protein VFP05_18835 [Thermomicrobiales bacterium]|jgi:hypothetical protein|nr:hypothetical protein [Thermomicrobiales bacterium]